MSIRQMLSGFRRTGRTQRMLDEAVRLADKHGECIIVAADDKQAGRLAARLAEQHQGVNHGRWVALAGGSVHFEVHLCGDPPSMSLADGLVFGRQSPILADHRVFEVEVRRRLGWALQQWDTWTNPMVMDEPTTSAVTYRPVVVMPLTTVIAVWDVLHVTDTGDLGYADLERALEAAGVIITDDTLGVLGEGSGVEVGETEEE